MTRNKSPEIQSESSQKKTKEMIITSLSPDHIFPDSNAVKIGGEGGKSNRRRRRRRIVSRKRRHISILDIREAKWALKKMKDEVQKKKEETYLMKTELAQTQTAAEEMESMLVQMMGNVYDMF